MTLYHLGLEDDAYLDRIDPALFEFVTSREYALTGNDLLNEYQERGLDQLGLADGMQLERLPQEKCYESPKDVFRDLFEP